MPEIVPVVLAAWVVLGVVLFWRLPGRDAALIVLIGGWAFLPVGSFPASVFADPVGSGGSMHALAIPTSLLVNKATAIALACLAGSMIFDWAALRPVRPSRLDLPIAIWCVIPVISALVNGLGLAEGLAQARYLALAWGVPYLMGRVYLIDNESLRRLGLGLVLAGLACAPLCLIELVRGPFLYGLLYGRHPYQLEGAVRFLGHRPLLFFEHGNQLGMWLASAAVASAWLWRSGRLVVVAGLPGSMVTAGLVLLCLVCQSLGSVLLMATALAFLFLSRRPTMRPNPAFVGAAALFLTILVWTSVAEAASRGGIGGQVRDMFQGVGKQSFNWRLARSFDHLPRVTERPLTGWARANWSSAPDHAFLNPVNLGFWLLSSGMYGVLGLASPMLALILPAIEVGKWLPRRSWLNPGCSAVTLVVVLLLMNTADLLVNSTLILPLLAGAGGLASWSLRRYEGY
jgi:hypothetical protein